MTGAQDIQRTLGAGATRDDAPNVPPQSPLASLILYVVTERGPGPRIAKTKKKAACHAPRSVLPQRCSIQNRPQWLQAVSNELSTQNQQCNHYNPSMGSQYESSLHCLKREGSPAQTIRKDSVGRVRTKCARNARHARFGVP